MELIITDGGRRAAGYKGHCGDCEVRAIAIAAKRPYKITDSQECRQRGTGYAQTTPSFSTT